MIASRLEVVDTIHLRRSTAPFLCRLKSSVDLTDKEERFVETLQADVHTCSMGTHIYAEGDSAVHPWIVATGWACRMRALPDGRRQIISLFLPGDSIGVLGLQHAAAQCTIAAITDVELLNATRLAEAVNHIAADMPNIVEAFRKEAIHRRAHQLDHILRLGRLTALERTAHLILELHDRMEIAGLAHDGRYPLLLTQSQLGEALGLSLVHVNRTVQQLRHDGLIELKSGWASIFDRERMELLCDFKKIVV